MVRGQSMGLRASLYPHAPALGHVHARSASLSRDTPRIRFFLLLPRRDQTRGGKNCALPSNKLESLKGLIGFNGVFDGRDAGLSISRMELEYS